MHRNNLESGQETGSVLGADHGSQDAIVSTSQGNAASNATTQVLSSHITGADSLIGTTAAYQSILVHAAAPSSTSDPATGRSTRPRTLTDKGQEYQVNLLKRRFSSTENRILRQCKLVDELLLAFDADVVKQELANLDKLLPKPRSSIADL